MNIITHTIFQEFVDAISMLLEFMNNMNDRFNSFPLKTLILLKAMLENKEIDLILLKKIIISKMLIDELDLEFEFDERDMNEDYES